MSVIGNLRDFQILTNNPLVPERLENLGPWTVEYCPGRSLREILVEARDRVYAGHILYTHPLSGSVKPNETPYKSVVVSRKAWGFDMEQAELIANAIAVVDKFRPLERDYGEQVRKDFQLIDYTLLAGALGV